ncbi:Bardet-Biedl syndrome 2 protein-like protein [Diplonema papillatum]|nr:Bardet-Biedl syndrome 2 protein-like protein [Diplonema papillatum]KAJ9455477.1 Bardet-Biedl syndrome 2 protein-like protein [Diplonema papillatum]KAJ9455478.1 Bardet-Biedl syndrome 2 protein-like protein [Diplonema papillatum]KAJ9455479.1 Bardet-Biedl syndrome 2 protein-like protein [Diplonema papillatum]
MARKAAPGFELSLGNDILEGLADVGVYDGTHPALTCATSGGKIFVHCPHERPATIESRSHNMKPEESPIKYLNINRQVTALKTGRYERAAKHDTLLIGTQTNLLAFNVEANSDLFYKEVQDGINTMTFGQVGTIESPLAVVGGNCSIQGFDKEGQELFWTVTGDNVTALALMDMHSNGLKELLVGSEDYEIRIFKNEEVITETTETDKVIALHPMQGTRYAYALANGTVGVYDKHTRAWRFKSKHRVSCLSAHDLDSDGVPELVAGWQNGKLEGRHDKTGEAVFKDTFPSSVSALVVSDYRMDGRECLIGCSYDGLIRGYQPFDKLEDDTAEMDEQLQEQVRTLMQQQQNLSQELRVFEDNMEKHKKGEKDTGLIPETTKVTASLKPNRASSCVTLVLKSTPPTTIIKLAVVTAEFLFGSNESKVCFAPDDTASNTMNIDIAPEKDVGTMLHIKAVVGSSMGKLFHVFEMEFRLPKFSMYVCVRDNIKNPPQGIVTVAITERVNRVTMWAEQSFNFTDHNQSNVIFCARFFSLRTGELLLIDVDPEKGGLVIKGNNMEVVGDIIQDLCQTLQIKELEATADFPAELDDFAKVLMKVDGYNAVRIQLTMEMADSSQLVKALVIRAEDARILSEMPLMRQHYSKLHELNSQLIGEYIKRANNHNELLTALREVNAMIQKAARLRMGQAKTRVIAECREAIKSNHIPSLYRIIKLGHMKS